MTAVTLLLVIFVGITRGGPGPGRGERDRKLLLQRSAQPHVALIGRIPGTEHYRNVERYQVETDLEDLGLRIDEGLLQPSTAAAWPTSSRPTSTRTRPRGACCCRCRRSTASTSAALSALKELHETLERQGPPASTSARSRGRGAWTGSRASEMGVVEPWRAPVPVASPGDGATRADAQCTSFQMPMLAQVGDQEADAGRRRSTSPRRTDRTRSRRSRT